MWFVLVPSLKREEVCAGVVGHRPIWGFRVFCKVVPSEGDPGGQAGRVLVGAVQRHVIDGGVDLVDDGLAVVLMEICYIIASDDYRRRQHIVF